MSETQQSNKKQGAKKLTGIYYSTLPFSFDKNQYKIAELI